MNTGTAFRHGGKVIKTLTNIRFIRSLGGLRLPAAPVAAQAGPPPQEQSLKSLVRKTQKQASEAYVQRDHEQAATVQVRPPPQRRSNRPACARSHADRRAVSSDPDTEVLIAWFHEMRARLPAKPFHLTPWQRIVNPMRFYDALVMDIAAYPHGLRSHIIGEDLRHLREHIINSG